ncbi:MAG: hypothetical protein ACKODX_12615 [Gemmata sp.]
MMHFSCDICSKDMSQTGAERYVLKMEAFAAIAPSELTDEDLETDHVEEMARLLSGIEEGEEAPQPLPQSKKMRFDLCHNCFRKFMNDPLGRESASKFHFSQN